jgi:4'-phosphopantetheinyl transferase
MVEALDSAQVPIWFFRWDAPPRVDLARALYALLSQEERARHAAFHFDRDRDAYLFAHSLVRRVLSQYDSAPAASWRFECNEYGKPFIAAPSSDLYFSLTHTAGLVACAVSLHAEIGVDAERIDRAVEFLMLARRFFAPPEADTLEAAPETILPERFFTLWTLKEAYIKARGMGLSLPLHDFEMRPCTSGAAEIAFLRPTSADDADWRLHSFGAGPHLISAAVRAPIAPRFVLRDGIALLNPLG